MALPLKGLDLNFSMYEVRYIKTSYLTIQDLETKATNEENEIGLNAERGFLSTYHEKGSDDGSAAITAKTTKLKESKK